jgi:hypothetical protein
MVFVALALVKLAALAAIKVVDDEADDEPDEEADPGARRKPGHEEETEEDAQDWDDGA